jgi:hypothetical protein
MFGVNTSLYNYSDYSDISSFPIDGVSGMYEDEYTALSRYGNTTIDPDFRFYIGLFNQSYNETLDEHKYWFARFNYSYRNKNSYMCNETFIKSLNQSYSVYA